MYLALMKSPLNFGRNPDPGSESILDPEDFNVTLAEVRNVLVIVMVHGSQSQSD